MRREGGEKLSDFARALLNQWRALGLPRRGERAVVAASGGADSTALLVALAELKGRGLISNELQAAHLDHGLRGAAGAEDARWIGDLTRSLGFEFAAARAGVRERASATGDNLEQAARRERYEFLARAARAWDARLVLTGHTLDDQAETVLLALLRGSGADGLGAMMPVRPFSGGDPPLLLLARPLLGWARRSQTHEYCAARGVVARADALNDDERFARVRVRRQLIPLLETFNPRAVETVARAAQLLRDDAQALEEQAAQLLREATDELARQRGGEEGARPEASPLRVGVLLSAAAAVRRRALRRWLAQGRGDLRRVELAHLVALERLLAGDRGGRVAELPGGACVERRGRWIFFRGTERTAREE